MSIYRYTLFKFFKAKSTWIIMFIVVFGISFLLGGVIPFVFIKSRAGYEEASYVRAVIGTVSGVTIFSSVFASVFSGFKSASTFRDEIENGTFLILLSKPIRRWEIVLYKWLALVTIVFIYSFVTIFFYCISITIFDTGYSIETLLDLGIKPISSEIFFVGMFIFLIVFICSLIFCAIGILISSRLSSAATIGILIAFGLVIPITSFFSTYLRKDAVYTFNNSSIEIILARSSRSASESKKVASRAIANYFKDINSPGVVTSEQLGILGLINGDRVAEIFENSIYTDLPQRIDNVRGVLNNTRLNLIGGLTNEYDTYADIYFLDLNYHFSQMASLAFERAIPETYRSQLSNIGESSILAPQKISVDSVLEASKYLNDLNNFSAVYNTASSPISQGTIFNLLVSLDLYRLQDFGDAFLLSSKPELAFNAERFARIKKSLDTFINKDQTILSRNALLAQLKSEMDKTIPSMESSNNVLITRPFLRNYFLYLFSIPLPETIVSNLYDQVTSILRGQSRKPINFDFLQDFSNFDLGKIIFTNVSDTEGLVKKELMSFIFEMLYAMSDLETYKLSRDLILGTISRMYYYLQPLNSFLYYGWRIRNFLSDFSTVIYNADQLRSLNLPEVVVTDRDLKLAEILATLASKKSLASFTTSSYSDRDAVIITFSLLSLVLVPLTFPLIRKSDFR